MRAAVTIALAIAISFVGQSFAFESARDKFAERGVAAEQALVRQKYIDSSRCAAAEAATNIRIAYNDQIYPTDKDNFIAVIEGPCGFCNELGCRTVFLSKSTQSVWRVLMDTFSVGEFRTYQPEPGVRGLCVQTKAGAEFFVFEQHRFVLAAMFPSFHC